MKRKRRNKAKAEVILPKRIRRKANPVNEENYAKPIVRKRRRNVTTKIVPKEPTLADVKQKKRRVPWNPDFLRLIYHMALLGAKEDQICEALGVSHNAIDTWKRTRPEVLKALREGKIIADAKMAESFYHAGVGYSHPEDKIIHWKEKKYNEFGKVVGERLRIKKVRTTKHYPPNVTAGSKWLNGRHPELWGENKSGIEAQVVNINTINFNEFSDDEIKLLAKMGFQQQGLEAPIINEYEEAEYIDDGTDEDIEDIDIIEEE